MKAMSKSELARAAGVSRRTLMRWLQDPEMQKQIKAFRLKKQQKKLPGKLIKKLIEHYVIDIA
jgi:DNA invertase Pin-like site-specific DNA recombinase